jgi:hypothetical protein
MFGIKLFLKEIKNIFINRLMYFPVTWHSMCQKILYCFVELGTYDVECPLFWPYMFIEN